MEQQHSQKKIGILGGSFDPIHQGHLNIAESAREEFSLDEVWFIPAGHSPNKEESSMSAAGVRAEMTALALKDYPYFKMSSMEIESEETSYTYRTLTKLCARYPNVKFYFIMGADSLDYLERWMHPEIICQKAVLLTAVRDYMDLAVIEQKIKELKQLFEAEIYPVYGGRTDISSSGLRRELAHATAKPTMLPQAVWEYICEHSLYTKKKNLDRNHCNGIKGNS